MSTSINAPALSDYSWMNSLVNDAANVKQKLNTLTNQASTGLVSTSYAGLGAGASVSLNLNPQVADLQTWQNNINAASGNMQVTQTAMTQLQSIAQNFYAQLDNLNGLNTSEVDSIASNARQALSQVTNLLDSTDGGTYVFSGQDTSNPPIPNPDNILNSGFYTQIATAVAGLGVNGAAATEAATLATASSNATGTSPFSAYMSQPASVLQPQIPTVQIGQSQFVSAGLLASSNASAVSPADSTTGSYARDLMRSLATLGSLSSSQINDTGFQDLVQDTRTCLGGAVTAMAEDAGMLGNTQASLTTSASQLADTQTALTAQISSAQDVDLASTLSQLSLVQTQMQASYQVIGAVSGLSLAKFLPVG